MDEQVRNLAERLLAMGFDDLPEREPQQHRVTARSLHQPRGRRSIARPSSLGDQTKTIGASQPTEPHLCNTRQRDTLTTE